MRWQPSMVFRVRASAVIMNQRQEVLLVLHDDPVTRETWLMPPGGGLEAGENALEAVVREVKEECGIICQPGKLLYIREYVSSETGLHHLGLFFEAHVPLSEGPLTAGHDPELEHQLIQSCGYYSRDAILKSQLAVYPEILKNQFWRDLKQGFTEHDVYLGQQRE